MTIIIIHITSISYDLVYGPYNMDPFGSHGRITGSSGIACERRQVADSNLLFYPNLLKINVRGISRSYAKLAFYPDFI